MSVTILKYAVYLMLASWICLSTALAGDKQKEIRVDVDLSRYQASAGRSNKREKIRLDVRMERLEPESSEYNAASRPAIGLNQLGFMRYSDAVWLAKYTNYSIVSKGSDIQRLVYQAVEIAMLNSGYQVISPPGSADESGVIEVNAVVKYLWLWREDTDREGKYRFYYQIITDFSQSETPFSSIGEIESIGYLNGSNPTATRSWRNTTSQLFKVFIPNLEERLRGVDSAKSSVGESRSSVSPRKTTSENDRELDVLTEQLKKLAELKNSGLLSEEDYQSLRRKAIDTYKQ